MEDFERTDDIAFDNSILKRDFTKICHQQDAQLNKAGKHVEFFGEKNIYHQIGNSYLQFDIGSKKWW